MDSTLWYDMMAYLRTKHAAICRQWFDDLEPVGLESGTLVVHTRNSVQQNYLQTRCLAQFIEAAQAVTRKLVGVVFVNGNHEGLTPAPTGVRPPTDGLPETSIIDPDPEAPIRLTPLGGTGTGSGNGNGSSHASQGSNGSHGGNGFNGGARSDEYRVKQNILSPDYSFGTFVTGPENNLAHAASVAVANQPGTAYNPLFIHGGVGLGKTHLLQAICQAVVQREPGMRISYLSCESFVNDFIDCVQNGLMQEFRARYRNVDLLVIDDIQFLAKRDRTQEEFFHTFNELYQAKKQIVLSSDRPPAEISELEERLVSRFQWGLVADVTRPTYETRVAIVRAKAKLRGLDMPDDVISYVAERIESNARELEGAISTLQLHANTRGVPITLELAHEVLGGGDPGTSQVTLQHIISAVTAHYDVKLSELQSKSRQKSIAEPRQVCMYLARKRTRFSLQETGGYFGGRDHTTVMHSIKAVEVRMKANPNFANTVHHIDDDITRKLTSGRDRGT